MVLFYNKDWITDKIIVDKAKLDHFAGYANLSAGLCCGLSSTVIFRFVIIYRQLDMLLDWSEMQEFVTMPKKEGFSLECCWYWFFLKLLDFMDWLLPFLLEILVNYLLMQKGQLNRARTKWIFFVLLFGLLYFFNGYENLKLCLILVL